MPLKKQKFANTWQAFHSCKIS